MDKDKNQKSNLGNDKNLKNVDTNKVTGVKVGDDRNDNASQTAPKSPDKTKELKNNG
jgi:hypothetical protein